MGEEHPWPALGHLSTRYGSGFTHLGKRLNVSASDVEALVHPEHISVESLRVTAESFSIFTTHLTNPPLHLISPQNQRQVRTINPHPNRTTYKSPALKSPQAMRLFDNSGPQNP
jgi:hypothetical protein